MLCILTELMTMSAIAVGQWAATVSSRDLLIGDFIWGSRDSSPPYITPCWTQVEEPRLQATLWLTGSKIIGPAACHARQGGGGQGGLPKGRLFYIESHN